MYAIVDIETTGSRADYNGITEIAVIVHDGTEIKDTFQTLLNPEQYIPEFITQLTGIDNAMVEDAPTFAEVAEELFDLLHDKIFVAHNAGFDYAFLKNAFETEGYTFNLKKLCTVRLSKKIFPGHRSYSLGRLCDALHVHIENRHRAMGDAAATATLFSMLLQNDTGNFVSTALKRNSKEQHLPPHLPKETLEALPAAPGVYYFLDKDNRVIYVGKAKNIKSRVFNHFTFADKHGKENALRLETHHITFELTGNELIALLLESEEIKRRLPKFNDAQKLWSHNYCIFRYRDQLGYDHLAIEKYNRKKDVLRIFTNYLDARAFLIEQISTYTLCPKLCHIQTVTKGCYNYANGSCLGACVQEESAEEYNARIDAMLQDWDQSDATYFIIDKGRHTEENSAVLVERGHYLGFGFFDNTIATTRTDLIRDCIKWRPDTPDVQRILAQYLQHFPGQRVSF